MSSSQEFAARLIAQLAGAGATNFYLAPGARSQSLAIAAGQLAQAGKIQLSVRLDERSMGFVALGRAMSSGSPSVLITTSGTAVANLHPAVLEAHHSGVPLIVLSADRPARLRGKGANQTTNQVGIFADALRQMVDVSVPEMGEFDPASLALDAVASAIGTATNSPGPVQLNLQFQEPLSANEPSALEFFKPVEVSPSQPQSPSELSVEVHQGAVVVAGSLAGPQAVEFAKLANLPLLAEPPSGARYSEQAVVNYAAALKTELAEQVTQVFVYGKPTLSRAIMRLISKAEVWVCNSPQHGVFDPFGNAMGFADQLVPRGQSSSDWLESWKSFPASSTGRAELANLIWESTKPDENLLFGASQIIREAEAGLSPRQVNAYANRGLAGIDGTVSTAIGLAQGGSRTRALIGDLTLLHDASALNVSTLGALDLQLIVGNDGGGEIFRHLEVAQSLSPEVLEKLFLTPQQVNLEQLAAAYGWNYRMVTNLGELQSLLSEQGLWLIDYLLSPSKA
ncbi:2-succinyl-5-enolpyruvyl-6-hydroxy-3-cyclohexene-1-carboxylic-acid synthase [Aquiluna borgnonia]|uniref:2-succinyl-5-enolpyruvyl-6-hydroxy-3-cyclohexene-1-carboxylate synthase n=1 Tax=Aquiluna borgnonia TaxID=2499157 RepID=A0A7D4Q4R1_9MICO|nr:2-succinyl-5-enolpyruvyl-6-hydroxy-3-cyclohexene-1-carboxylic-acid synthase [Aquiluna borgnonia]QKJ25769.1 2-succinyl-5-enolpyruvyl-6-hydroxy-3-cyclohexene-1-carboxylic-acid synthase [Aquiluna borgnonia]